MKKTVPTNKSLWEKAKNQAKQKFDKYPSAYANLWASKYYKKHGGKWRMSENDVDFDLEILKEEYVRDVMESKYKGGLRNWLKQKWVRINSSGEIAGDCGTSKNKDNPDRCLPYNKAKSLTKSERAATNQKKKEHGSDGKQFVPNTKKAKVKS